MCAVTGLNLLGEFKVIRKRSTRSTLIDVRSFFIPAKKKVVTAYLKVMQSLRSTRKATKADLGLLAAGAMLQRKRTSSRAVLKGLKGAVVYSNILITVSTTHAQEVWTSQGGHGLHATLNSQSKKFIGIHKEALRKHLSLSSSNAMQPLVGWITRRVPQKGLHLIRHAIYRMLELGGQLVLLGSSPVPHIQGEFEGFVNHFKDHPNVRLILKYDEVLSHSIDAASDMFIIPSIFEPYGLTQLIVMGFGSVPIVRKTGGLNDSVFDVDDHTIPLLLNNGFTFLSPDEQGVNSALDRAFNLYMKNNESWQQLVKQNMKIYFTWDDSAAQYVELYEMCSNSALTPF